MSVIDEYMSTIDGPQKAELERVRSIVLSVAPDAEEVMSYGMPAFRYKRKYLVGFKAFRNHLSLFPTPGPIEHHKDELSRYKLSKGTIQFKVGDSLPESTIMKLIRTRIKEIEG